MKKLIALFSATLVSVSLCMATSGSCGANLEWSYDGAGTLTITGTGAMTNWPNKTNVPWYNASFRDEITKVILPEGLTSIGRNAFSNCSTLVDVTIPSTVATIKERAFANCVALPAIDIPVGIETIEASAFTNCRALKDVTVHWTEGTASIDNQSFPYGDHRMYLLVPVGMSYLYSIHVSLRGFTYFYNGKCGDNLYWTLDDKTQTKLTLIGTGEMYDYENASAVPWHTYRTNITSVTLPNGLTNIGSYTFYECNSLSSIAIPSSVTDINKYAFANCSNLSSVSIPSSVASIGDRAFENCSSLESIDIPSVVNGIGSYAFHGCSSLDNMYVHWSTPPTDVVDSSFITVSSSASLHVPCEAKTLYETAVGWQEFDSIVEYPAPTMTLLVDDTLRGSAKVVVQNCSEVTIQAAAHPGVVFDQWSDGNTDTLRTITLTGDSTLTAYFQCNSIITSISDTAHYYYDWNGLRLNKSGDYATTFQSVAGCDSTIRIHLLVFKYYVAGNGQMGNPWCDEWVWVADGSPMYNNSVTYHDVPAGAYEFKITDGQWGIGHEWAFGSVDSECSSANVLNGGSDNNGNIKLLTSLTQDITISFDGDKICVLGTFDDPNSLEITEYTIVGDYGLMGVAWDVASTENNMTLTAPGVYTLTKKNVAFSSAEQVYNYKVVGNHNYSVFQLPVTDGQTIRVNEEGLYDVIFTLNLNGSQPTLSAEAIKVVSTAIHPVNSDNIQCAKILRNGQLFIIRDGRMYTVQGQEVK